MQILGVKIDTLNFPQSLEKIEDFLATSETHYVVTPNPEIILASQSDPELKTILNSADLALADGFGLLLVSKFKLKERVTGVDMLSALLLKYPEKKYKFILNPHGLSKMEDLQKVIKVQFAENNPEIIFVALGSPAQEKWIKDNIKKYPSARLIMTVGGGIDFLTGKQVRAPKFMRQIGLEWLWRLFKQPWRYKRIFNATLKFLWKVYTQ